MERTEVTIIERIGTGRYAIADAILPTREQAREWGEAYVSETEGNLEYKLLPVEERS